MFENYLIRLCCVVAFSWASSAVADRLEAPEAATGLHTRTAVVRQHALVVAANPLAVAAGVEMLKRGGNAIDAAIAVELVLGLVEPQSSGIGGGSFMMYYQHSDKQVLAYDGRETAPAAATADMFMLDEDQPMSFYQAVVGGRSVGVPGLLRMLELAHQQHGRLPWRILFTPAIKLANKGFIVSPRLHSLVAKDAYLSLQPAARTYFYHADGTPIAAGERLVNRAYANVLLRVANEGAKAFYTGKIAQDIVTTVHMHPTNPGRMHMGDLAQYQAKSRAPLCGSYHAYVLCGMPPPSSGGVALLQIFGILGHYDVAGLQPDSVQAVHLISEAERLAFADRNMYLADDDFVAVPIAGLLDPAYLRQRASLIDTEFSMGVATAGVPAGAVSMSKDNALELPSTSHLSIVDKWGNAVSMTSSIEDAFGSRHMVDGFLLNNELTDFSFMPDQNGKLVANRVQANKRPRSSMTPTLILDGQHELVGAIGSPGGSSIINYVAKTLIGVLDWHLDMQQAVALPNFGSRNGPTELESGTGLVSLQSELEMMGHDVKVGEANSGLHGFMRVQNGWMGGVDPRREGSADGY
ncbi:gamma-glutamyltransferase [Sulfuriferula nivalis]|uniref:Glutathione hydrolase proenzyme n=1 Tax=Sulfuriferula nivalis TaxID=2675298 RepID=A0A809S871_9PROT|nr:gamma-glutamyltransferase [Sulfuriferula nivalis]BBP00303.1 gamma-glutamyltranspeptidase [Sulfuriferula nivalis]